MRLYSYWRSSASYRARIVLALKRIEYEYVAVDISKKALQQHTQAFAGVNPMRQVPVLTWVEDGREQRLTQSVAICEFLDERWPTPRLLPKDPLERALVREAMEIVNSGIQPLQNFYVFSGDTKGAAEVIARGLSTLERRARAQPSSYFVGETPTLADVFIIPQLFSARRFGVSLEEYPWLSSIEHRALSLDAFASARPERQPDAPQEADEAEGKSS